MHNTSLLFFLICAVLAGTIFLLALIELFFTIQRRRTETRLRDQLHQIKISYNETINKIVLEHDSSLDATDHAEAEAALAAQQAQLAKLEADFREKLDGATHSQDRALRRAKTRAKELEEQAKQQADEYLATRQKEVESDLMDLVIHVTKKVLPETLTYEIQKELVLAILHEVELDKTAVEK